LHVGRHVLAAAIIILAAGCRGSDWQNAVDDVIAAERAFAARAMDTTVQQAFLESIANDAVLFRPGPTDARALLGTQPYPADFQLEWTPEWADASLDGELGYTMGPWRAGRRNQSSQPGAYGTYVTIWKRAPADGWRVILDFGTGGASEFAARELRHPASPPAHADAAERSSLEQSIRLVDEDFIQAIGADSSALVAFVSDDTRFLRDRSTATIGTPTASAAYAAIERSARWSTAGSDISTAGGLGFVFGTWTSAPADSAGGSWLRIWRRDAAGDWKLAIDAVTGSRPASIL
jgi:ketosteroid isomerase-like protein